MEITFQAQEYTAEDTFISAEYRFNGETQKGWDIYRNGAYHLRLGQGYELLKTISCGICSTDIDRRFLPFDLPQVIGHEVVAQRMQSKEKVVVEINDTPWARGDLEQDPFCREGLHTHSPGRMVLGIDRLPGGFGPYLLAPVNAVVPLDGVDENTAVLVEPFAAALQAVNASPPCNGDEVAVLGPGRLGTLMVAALVAYRTLSGTSFKIDAVAKYDKNLEICGRLGADIGINLCKTDPSDLHGKFDIVYDTTGTVDGFEMALHQSRREVHLKSTNGQSMCGIDHLTAFVVDELSLLSFRDSGINFTWPEEERTNTEVYIAPENAALKIDCPGMGIHAAPLDEAERILAGEPFFGRLPRFDLAVAGSCDEIDRIIRPSDAHENALVRPRGAILFKGEAKDNKLLEFIGHGGKLRASRCGDFHQAVGILKQNPDLCPILAQWLISHVFTVSELPAAFDHAKRKGSLKVVIRH